MRIQLMVQSLALAVLFAGVATQSLTAQRTAHPLPADTIAGVEVQGLAAIVVAESLLESEMAGDAAAAARVKRAGDIASRGYQAAAGSRALTRELLARAIVNHYAHRSAAASGDARLASVNEQLLQLMLLHAAQNAQLVEQHDRLIQLLEAAAATR